MYIYYRAPIKLWEGNFFINCVSVRRGDVCLVPGSFWGWVGIPGTPPVHAPQKVQSLFGVSMPGPRSLVEGVSMPSTRSLLGMGTSGTPLVHPLIKYTPWC